MVKEVERTGIIDASFNLDKRASTAYDVEPAADFNEENTFHEVGLGVFELEGFVFDQLLKL
jgi:hypothetical protein